MLFLQMQGQIIIHQIIVVKHIQQCACSLSKIRDFILSFTSKVETFSFQAFQALKAQSTQVPLYL